MTPKPYGFVPVPESPSKGEPVWHDGLSSTKDRLSGEVRFELTTLTPLLVGCERRTIVDLSGDSPWSLDAKAILESTAGLVTFLEEAAAATYPNPPNLTSTKQARAEADRQKYLQERKTRVVQPSIDGCDVGLTIDSKSVLSPLRAPWGNQPVILQADSIKGLLRHELGALLGAPMERVAERSYSYRPNATSSFVNPTGSARLVGRIARVPQSGFEMRSLDPSRDDSPKVRVPTTLELLDLDLKYDKDRKLTTSWYRFDPGGTSPTYRGGQGAGDKLNSKRQLHSSLGVNPSTATAEPVPADVIDGYLHTVRHLTDESHGHFSSRHPDFATVAPQARDRILKAATSVVFEPGDLIWVEWDKDLNCIVSFGWHYYYRWAYQDTVRLQNWIDERKDLCPIAEEIGAIPAKLSAVRRLFGYTASDEDGTKDIGKDDHSQLMGRVFVNSAIEIVPEGSSDEQRFIPFTFLRELGMPRPSAVEHYIEQPYAPTNSRPSDTAKLVTYGDAVSYDTPGKIAGRKFYFDRADAYGNSAPWCDASPSNRLNDRSTLALFASKPDRTFRFTVRFRDLDVEELVAVLLALCPNQFASEVGGTDEYCSKLGYARPLGWGSVQIEAKQLLMLDASADPPRLAPPATVAEWFRSNRIRLHAPQLNHWLGVHRRRHPDAGPYPIGDDGKIYTYHTKLRSKHAFDRRHRPSP